MAPIIIVKRAKDSQAVLNGIEAVRNILGQCWFDAVKCAKGVSALESYHAEYDETKDVLSNKPLHSWACHAADAARTFGVGYAPKKKTEVLSVTEYMTRKGFYSRESAGL